MMPRNYAAVGSKIIGEKEDISFIDLNTEKLCSRVCINYLLEGMFKKWRLCRIYCTYANLMRQLSSYLTFTCRLKNKIREESMR